MAPDRGSSSRRAAGILALISLAAGSVALGQAPQPITVYKARNILTMERSNPSATAVAVKGKRILSVGSLEQVRTALGDAPFTLDSTFEDKVILPGFIDQHLHPVLGALTLSTHVIAPEAWVMPGRTFEAALTPEQYIERLKKAHATLSDPEEWLFSWGYHELWHGELSLKVLDNVSKKRPILIWQRSCHEFFLNSAAIKKLGLNKDAMLDKGAASEFFKWDEGHWWETGVNLILEPVMKVLATPERFEAGLKQMVSYLHSNGVTAFNEPGALFSRDMWRSYQKILGGKTTPFYSFFLPDARSQVDKGLSLDESLADAECQVRLAPEGKVSFFPKQIKLFADGAIISQMMQMKDGYTDGHEGAWLMSPEDLEQRSKLYWDAGYQLHIHVNGDAGLDLVLEVLERRMRENPRADHRTVIVHFANSNEQQIGRLARLGALVSANPYYTVGFADKYGEHGLGKSRADAMVRSASVLKHNIPLSLHSDLPMGPSAPLYLAWCAVNRITPSGRLAEGDQRIGVEDALRAVTIEAAYSWRREHELGSIAPGKIANFTVLLQDPLKMDPTELRYIPIWGTVFEGCQFPVHEEDRSETQRRCLDAHEGE